MHKGHQTDRYQSIVSGCGSYLPGDPISNHQLIERYQVDSSHGWIKQRTGICYRHFADQDTLTSDLAFKACEKALADASLKASQIDMIIVATTTPDHTFPAMATHLQAKLGISGSAAFDVQAVCAGFVFALQCAHHAIIAGQAEHILVVGADAYSRILDWQDRGTCILFGDGAGAIILSKGRQATDRGVLSTHLASDGRYYKKLYVDGGVASTQTTGYVRMSGQEVFKFAVKKMASISIDALTYNDLNIDDVDWFVPHQANQRIIEKTGQKLGINPKKVIMTVQDYANTSAATIPIALDKAKDDGLIHQGQLVLLATMGGGFSWGSALIRW
ncbi:MAG: beta-ketoacyl-ACP synthase III [Pseudomonadota bacterium]